MTDLDPELRQVDDRGKQVSGAIEQCTRQHGRVHPLARRVGFVFVGFARQIQAFAGRINAGLGVMKSATSQAVDQALAIGQGIL